MKNKKFLYILGACCLSAVVGFAAISNCIKDTSVKEARAEGVLEYDSYPLNNLVLYTSGERDYSDLGLSMPRYSFVGSFKSVNNDSYDSIFFSCDGSIDSISFYVESSESTITFMNQGVIDNTLLKQNYLIFGTIESAWSIQNHIRTPLSVSECLYVLKNGFDVSVKPVADQFVFNQQINYYAPYSTNVSSQFVADSSMTTSGSVKSLYYDEVFSEDSLILGPSAEGNQWFTCAGKYYNEISLYYINAIAMSFDSSGEPLASNGFASYTMTLYYNNITGESLIANTRDTRRDNRSNVVGYYQSESSSWASPSYKVINLLFTPTEEELANLNRLNNSNYSGNSLNVDNSQTTLGDAMSLLSLGFQATTSLFTIQVLPGISLGLLLFLPLIAGIIVFVIWVVKR